MHLSLVLKHSLLFLLVLVLANHSFQCLQPNKKQFQMKSKSNIDQSKKHLFPTNLNFSGRSWNPHPWQHLFFLVTFRVPLGHSTAHVHTQFCIWETFSLLFSSEISVTHYYRLHGNVYLSLCSVFKVCHVVNSTMLSFRAIVHWTLPNCVLFECYDSFTVIHTNWAAVLDATSCNWTTKAYVHIFIGSCSNVMVRQKRSL